MTGNVSRAVGLAGTLVLSMLLAGCSFAFGCSPSTEHLYPPVTIPTNTTSTPVQEGAGRGAVLLVEVTSESMIGDLIGGVGVAFAGQTVASEKVSCGANSETTRTVITHHIIMAGRTDASGSVHATLKEGDTFDVVVVASEIHHGQERLGVMVGQDGSSTQLRVPVLLKQKTVVSTNSVDAAAAHSASRVVGQPYWQPKATPFHEDLSIDEEYRGLLTSLTAVIAWNLTATDYANLGVGVGPDNSPPTVIESYASQPPAPASKDNRAQGRASGELLDALSPIGGNMGPIAVGAVSTDPILTATEIPYSVTVSGDFRPPPLNYATG